MDVSEAQQAKRLRDENTKLKEVVVDLSLDKEMLKDNLAVLKKLATQKAFRTKIGFHSREETSLARSLKL